LPRDNTPCLRPADFLDPLHHEAATGRPSINLDGWMMDQGQNAAAFHRATADADVAVVEGVMGLFDGRDGASEAGSTAQMAKWLGAPVLLVLDCWALARSAAAMVKGFTVSGSGRMPCSRQCQQHCWPGNWACGSPALSCTLEAQRSSRCIWRLWQTLQRRNTWGQRRSVLTAVVMPRLAQEFDEQLRIGGLLLNRVGGAAHSKWLQDAISGSGVKADFLGGIPKVSTRRLRPLRCNHGRIVRQGLGQPRCHFAAIQPESHVS